MKKLIYLILFIPFIGFGQTYPHQIEPDTTHRMIMMTDTSVIDSPELEFVYFSIDSLVEQIARDTLGLDSSYWALDGNGSMYQKLIDTSNLFLLAGAGSSNTGSNSIGIGINALNANTQDEITAVGYLTLTANTGINNAAFGSFSLESNTTGSDNLAMGTTSLRNNLTGNNNVGIGSGALTSNTTASNGVAIGSSAMRNNLTGNFNVAIGSSSLYTNTAAREITSIGYQAGYLTTASRNTFIGYRASYRTVGADNVSIGHQASLNQTGSGNVSIGNDALLGVNGSSSGTNNTSIGFESGIGATGSSNVFLGYQAGYNETGSNKLYIENSNSATPLIYGDFSTDEVTINDDLYVNSLETSDYLYSNSDKILGGNWVDDDWTLTGNIDTLFFGDPSNIDTVIVSAGDPDQTLSFSNPDLTISGSGGNTIDISGVNYWDTNADGIYTLDNVGINTTPHATHPFYVVGTMWLDGPVRDGNGNFSGGTGNIMTANSSGEFLWESPSSISLSEFNNDLGLTQYWSLVGSDLFSNTGGAARDIIVGEIDMELPISGTPDQLMGRISSTGILNDINIGSGLSLISGTLSATSSSPWTDSGTYVETTGSENVYIPNGEALLVGTTTESVYAVDIASTVEMRLLGDLYDKNSSNGAADDILTSDGDQIEWVTPEISLTPPVLMCYQSSSQSISSSGGFISVPNTVNDSGFGTSTTQKSVPLTGYYRVSAAGTVTASTGNGFNYAINGGVTVTQSVDTAGSYGFSYTTILYMTSGTTVGLYMDATSSGNTVDEITLDVNYIKS